VSDIDELASSLLEEAKRFLEKASDDASNEAETANLHASVMLAFCALEAHVNAVADEVSLWNGLTPHELSVLREKDVRLKDGEFALSNGLKMHRLEDRICVLHRIGKSKSVSGMWRSHLAHATDLRNKLTHPKEPPLITIAAVRRSIEAVIETIDALYVAVYRKRFPAAHRRLESKLEF